MLRMLVLLIFSYLLCACGHLLSEELDTKTIKIHRTEYGKLANGQTIMQYELMTQSIKLKVITYGGIITHLEVPDKLGNFGDVVLGYDDLAGYEKNEAYFGALIGRYANRINNSEIDIKGHAVAVSSNRPPHQLHGGFKGFDKQVWQATTKNNGDSATINLSLFSPDGEEGFPGDLHMSVSYTVTHQGDLIIEYHATSDKTTVLNPTQHSYFNLSGNADADVLGHELSIVAEKIIEFGSYIRK